MPLTFTPSPDVAFILNALLDILEKRAKHDSSTRHSIKITLRDLSLPGYFSQTDPVPRLTANEQFIALEKANLLKLTWLPGETGNLLKSVTLPKGHATRNIAQHPRRGTHHATRFTHHAPLYTILNREPLSDARERLEELIRAELFRFSADDWRGRALKGILRKIRDGKSPTPFSLTDTDANLGLLTALDALSGIQTETPYRVFSVRAFNDSKRFDGLKSAIVRLARRGNPKWKKLSNRETLRELHLVANPNYIHLAGDWQLTTQNGEILPLGGFSPSIGFPAAQVESLHSATVHADAILCIENLTTFHEFIRSQKAAQRNTGHATRTTQHGKRTTQHALICLMGNPSPPIRQLLSLVPEEIPIYLWADLDYGGFNILSQFRKEIHPTVQPYLMDVETFEKHAHLSRPLTKRDQRNLNRLYARPELRDLYLVIEHILERGLKLEQEAIRLRE